MLQDIIYAHSVICDLKEITKKQKLDNNENYRINGMYLHINYW